MVVQVFNGYGPAPRAAVVLLSGLDSAAALHWASDRFAPVVAVGFDYGQPRAELAASQAIAERRGVPWTMRPIPEIGERRPDAGRDAAGVSRAFVPARNGILAWHAANVAARVFPGGRVSIVIGCNMDDSVGFPDCRPAFLRTLSASISDGLSGVVEIKVEAPWIYSRKAEIVAMMAKRPEALADMRSAVSCYRGTTCGACDACALRARAFAEAGVEDGEEAPHAACGGDPAREAR